MSDEPVQELHPEECWEFLRAHEFGRMAFHLADEVHIAPINYAVDGKRLVFRTAEGSKLLGVVMNEDVAFEIDEYDEDDRRLGHHPRPRSPPRGGRGAPRGERAAAPVGEHAEVQRRRDHPD